MKNYLTILFLILIVSCNDKGTHKKNEVELKEYKTPISFPLDENTKSSTWSLFLYIDPNGKEYLTFQNQWQNEILFYDLNSQELEFKIKPQYEGNNGVGSMIGYYIKNMDSIFLTVSGLQEIVIIDKNAVVKGKMQYEKTINDLFLKEFYSQMNHPIILIDNKMYIMPGCNRWAEKNPVCATIDLTNYTVEALLGLSYPSFPGADNKAKRAGIEEDVSRCYDGENFIYSFHFDESIYIVSPDHKTINRKPVKSNYINKVKYLDDYGNLTFEDGCKNPNYGNLLYDEYRNVYYRIAYPETKIEKGIRGMELLQYGRKNFSIIILDKDFTIIGETMFPDYTYNSNIMFIREDGLYISSSHFMNPEYSDDVLSFQRFDLVKK